MRPCNEQPLYPPALLYRKSHDLTRPLSESYPSTTAISSSVNPYSSYTSASISRSVASAFGVALKRGLDVRRPLGRELFVQVHAFGSALDQRDHPVVPRDVCGGGEVDGADGESSNVLSRARDPTATEHVAD
jgi:hypothetical protein